MGGSGKWIKWIFVIMGILSIAVIGFLLSIRVLLPPNAQHTIIPKASNLISEYDTLDELRDASSFDFVYPEFLKTESGVVYNLYRLPQSQSSNGNDFGVGAEAEDEAEAEAEDGTETGSEIIRIRGDRFQFSVSSLSGYKSNVAGVESDENITFDKYYVSKDAGSTIKYIRYITSDVATSLNWFTDDLMYGIRMEDYDGTAGKSALLLACGIDEASLSELPGPPEITDGVKPEAMQVNG